MRNRTCSVSLSTAIVLIALRYMTSVLATPVVGFKAATIMNGPFVENDIVSKHIIVDSGENDRLAKA